MRSWLLALLLTLPNTVLADAMDLSALQTRFEQKVQDRLRAGLDPILGKDGYSLSVQSTFQYDEKKFAPSELYMPKLGMATSLPNPAQEGPFQFEKWVRSIDVNLSYSDALQGADEGQIKERVDQLLKPWSSVKKNVSVGTFAPVRTKAEEKQARSGWTQWPWTSFSVLLCGLFLSLAVLSSIRRLADQKAAAPAPMSGPSYNPSLNENVSSSPAPAVWTAMGADGGAERDGLKKWHEWLQDDPRAAREFFEKQARGGNESQELVHYIVQYSDLKLIKGLLSELGKESLAKLKDLGSVGLSNERRHQMDELLSQSVTQSCIDQRLDSDQLLKWVHDFSIEECLVAAEQEPQMLALFMKAFSTPHLEQILNKFPTDKFQEFLKAQNSGQIFDFDRLAQKAHASVTQFRQQKQNQKERPLAKWMLVASHLDAEREEAFYLNSASFMEGLDIENFAQENFPQFLMTELPAQVVKPVLNSYPFQERADLIASFPEETRKRLLSYFEQEARVKEVLEIEFEQIAADPERVRGLQARQPALHKDYFHRVRKYLRSSEEHRAVALTCLRDWLKNQGAGHDRKNPAA